MMHRNNYRDVKAKVDSYRKPKSQTQQQLNSNLEMSNNQHQITRSGEIEHARNVRNSRYNNGNSNNGNINNNNKVYSTPAKSNNIDNNKTNSTPAKNNSNSCTANNGEDTPTNAINGNDKETLLENQTDKSNVLENQDIPSGTIGEGESKLAKLLPSAETVVSSTTATATQPLKIQTDLDVTGKEAGDSNGTSLYLPDASDLRPMSVSNAMNRMNNTVLDSKTLMRETNLSFKLSPAAVTAASMKEEAKSNGAVSGGAFAKPSITTPVIAENGGSNNTLINVISSTDTSNVLSVNSKTNSVYNSVKSYGEHSVGLGVPVVSSRTQQSANGRIREARTIVATDVKPINITVREKPADFEVQSGNVRIPIVANGVDDRPG